MTVSTAELLDPPRTQPSSGPTQSTSVVDGSSVVSNDSTSNIIDVTEDGKVRKVVVREGSGGVPPLHAQCLGTCT
jgi:hypothetical protein